MSNIDYAVEELISSVLSSETYREYSEVLAKVKQEPDLKRQIDEFRRRNYELQNEVDYDFNKIEQFEKENESFREIPLVSDFLAAELAFCRMMQEINLRVTGALHFE